MKTQLLSGKCSLFGGPNDTGMQPLEPVAVYRKGDDDPYHLFISSIDRLGHDLNPASNYCAMRWNYDTRTHQQLRDLLVFVKNPTTGIEVQVHPADWGPNVRTGRIIDLSPGAAKMLGVKTDDVVSILIQG